jgi:hypothetical protein
MTMTAAQLAHLAELAAFAADYFAATDPCAARMFGDTALRADTLSAELRRNETRNCDGTEMAVPTRGWEPA